MYTPINTTFCKSIDTTNNNNRKAEKSLKSSTGCLSAEANSDALYHTYIYILWFNPSVWWHSYRLDTSTLCICFLFRMILCDDFNRLCSVEREKESEIERERKKKHVSLCTLCIQTSTYKHRILLDSTQSVIYCKYY